jgi:hypothetical protein
MVPPHDARTITSFQDVPAEERHVGDGIAKAGTLFDLASVFGRSDGHVVVIDMEDFKVVARHSANQGTTFDPGITLAGGAGQPDGEMFQAAQAADGTIYVALAIVDPLGGLGLQVVRSLDMGQSWSAPIDIVRHGNPLHDVLAWRERLAVAAGAAGRVAVLFADGFYGKYYVVSSMDYGQTWTAAVRVDPGAPDPLTAGSFYAFDLAITPNGSIHVVYVQPRGAAKLMYTRSTDGARRSSPNARSTSLPGHRATPTSRLPRTEACSSPSRPAARWSCFAQRTTVSRLSPRRSSMATRTPTAPP